MPRTTFGVVVLLPLLACSSGDSAATTAPPTAAPTIASIRVLPESLSLAPRAGARLSAEVRLSDGSAAALPISWSSSAPDVAVVSADGVVTAIAGGHATIVATVAGRTASAGVRVEHESDLDARGVPRFVSHDYIELSRISRITRFRSGFGHDYSDAIERCRSMKHYFQPYNTVDWSRIVVASPAAGRVSMLRAEQTFGTQVQIVPDEQPAFTIVLFHVRPDSAVTVGSRLTAGQRIGTHIGSQTMSDVAIVVQTRRGTRLVSYFDAMTDALLQSYSARGIAARSTMILSAAERDADPLSCVGEQFQSPGNLPNWIQLQ
jgi:hypothetical protein